MSDEKRPHAILGDRSLFPNLRPHVYLAHSAVSPPSAPVEEAAREVLRSYATLGLGAYPRWIEQRETLRRDLAALIGAAAENVALMPNTSLGVTAVAQGFPWQAGDGVVVFEGEFPANVTPWQLAAKRFDLRVIQVPLPFDGAGVLDAGALDAALDRGARLVAVSAVQFQTGLRAPLRALAERCHARGAELFVDGIQAAGVVPLDVVADGVDYFASGGHKWLMGVEGTGFLYVRPERREALHPVTGGWLSHEDRFAFLLGGPGQLRYDRPLRDGADVLEGGSQPSAPLAALGAGVGLLRQLGLEAIFDHVSTYLDALEPGLVERGFTPVRGAAPAARSGILAARPPAGLTAADVCRGLGERGIAVTGPDGYVRFAPHWPNALSEVPEVLAALDDLLPHGGRR